MLPENNTIQPADLQKDVDAVNKISIVPQLLDVICRTTGMGFSAIARVTDEKWITCTTKDEIAFGLQPGDELDIENTFCRTIKKTSTAIFIEHAEKDPVYAGHPIAKMFGITSYVSYPIFRRDGSFFGTLCAIDRKPAKVKTPEIEGIFRLFSDLLSFHLEAVEKMDYMQHELQEEQKNAELREQFIAILGHDLRNPIATTKMSADILLKASGDKIVRRQANMIKSTSYRMEGLIENILDFARGRLGEGIQLQKEVDNTALEKEIFQVISEVKTVSPKRPIKTDIQLDLPVSCDKDRIAQLFSNLLSNADFHGANNDPVYVDVSARDGEFKISVTNSGEKIPDEKMKHLFQPFYRDKEQQGKQGLGLGLFIASEIAHAHQGEISVTSTEEATNFTFSMPLCATE